MRGVGVCRQCVGLPVGSRTSSVSSAAIVHGDFLCGVRCRLHSKSKEITAQLLCRSGHKTHGRLSHKRIKQFLVLGCLNPVSWSFVAESEPSAAPSILLKVETQLNFKVS